MGSRPPDTSLLVARTTAICEHCSARLLPAALWFLEIPYLDLLFRKLKHMQRRMHISPRHTPTMMPVTAWMSSSVWSSENRNSIVRDNSRRKHTNVLAPIHSVLGLFYFKASVLVPINSVSVLGLEWCLPKYKSHDTQCWQGLCIR